MDTLIIHTGIFGLLGSAEREVRPDRSLNNGDCFFFLELSAISINGQTIVHDPPDPLTTIFGTAIDKLQP